MARLDHTLVLDKKAVNRSNADFIFELRNLNWRSFSLIAKCSWGRDYMNLRFGERIQSYQIGISYNMDRYKVPYTKYIEALEKGDVITLSNSRDRNLDGYKAKLPDVDSVAPATAGVQSYVLYNKQLDARQQAPPTLDLHNGLFEKPPLYRFQNGAWKIVNNNRKKLNKIQKAGWYHADDLEYDSEMNGQE
ncbi:MAG: hypothetical protein IPJ82_25310 [Lewinellaceae bacterium]|nr:hypothetical protein [Lewinellaceae bacterium]